MTDGQTVGVRNQFFVNLNVSVHLSLLILRRVDCSVLQGKHPVRVPVQITGTVRGGECYSRGTNNRAYACYRNLRAYCRFEFVPVQSIISRTFTLKKKFVVF